MKNCQLCVDWAVKRSAGKIFALGDARPSFYSASQSLERKLSKNMILNIKMMLA